MKKKLFNVSNNTRNSYTNRQLILFIAFDLFFLIGSVVFAIFGMKDENGGSLSFTYGWMGIVSLLLLLSFIILSIFTSLYWVMHIKSL